MPLMPEPPIPTKCICLIRCFMRPPAQLRYKHEQFFLWPLCTHARKRASRPRPIRHVGAPATIYLATDWLTSFEAVTRRHRNPLKNGDRKSTRLNSSHVAISYAVFCLKKKKEDS